MVPAEKIEGLDRCRIRISRSCADGKFARHTSHSPCRKSYCRSETENSPAEARSASLAAIWAALSSPFSVDCDELAHRRAERGLSEGVDIDAVKGGQRERFAYIAEGGEPRVRIAAFLEWIEHDGRHTMHFRSMRRHRRRQSFKGVNGDGTCGFLQKGIKPALIRAAS